MKLRVRPTAFIDCVLFFFVANSRCTCQDCFRPNNTNGFPAFENYGNADLEQHTIPLHHLAIIPSYRFDCCGSIVQWGVDLDPAGGGDNMEYDLSMQVWRPQAVEATGCYSLVGSNIFSNIELSSDQVAVLTPSPSSSQTQDIIHFQPGDVIGFNVVRARNFDNRGVVVLLDRSMRGDRGYQTEEMWHADISNSLIVNPMCPFPIGTEPGRVLNTLVRAAPVISVSYSISSCPSAVPTRPPQPTPTTDGQVVQPTTRPGPDGATTQSATEFVPMATSSVGLGLIVGTVIAAMSVIIVITSATLMLICIIRRRKSRGPNDGAGENIQSSTYDYIDNGLPNIVSNTAYGVCLHSGTKNYSAGPMTGVDSEDAGTMKVNEAYRVTHQTNEPATSDDEGVYNYPAVGDLNDTLELKQNDAYALDEPVTTTANESYNYPAKFDPSNTIEAEANEAYAMNIVTEENKAYKPVVSASGTNEEYEYI